MLTEVGDLTGNVFVGGTLTALARVVDWANALLVQSAVSTITYTITDPSGSPVTGHNNVSLTIADVIFDTLQTSPAGLWTADSTGFNFAHTIDISSNPAFAVTGTHVLQYVITPTSAQPVLVRYSITAI